MTAPTTEHPDTILVINPNSDTRVTEGMDRSLDVFRSEGHLNTQVVTLLSGPLAIETQADIDSVVAPILSLAQEFPQAGAVVIGCFSDPGVEQLRKTLNIPVLGIASSGLLSACAISAKIGVVSILEASVVRHRVMYQGMGINRRVYDLPLNLHVADLLDEKKTWERLRTVSTDLVQMGAGSIVMGCAGMAAYRCRLEDAVGVKVIEPTLAAVNLARMMVR